MSTPDPARFDELLSRYLDASLDAAEEREFAVLLADETLAARFHAATQLDVEIAGLLAGSVPDEVMVNLVWIDLSQVDPHAPAEQRPRSVMEFPGLATPWWKRRFTPVLLALAATIVVLAGLAAYFLPRAVPPSPPVVVQTPATDSSAIASAVHGEVYLTRSTGRSPLTNGMSLEDGGTIETVGRGSGATVALRDGSKIELKGDSTFTAEFGPAGRRLVLQRGMLVATVTKQPEDAPLIFLTDRATATVRGTQLALVAEESGSYLIVTEGAVALRRTSGGPEVLIQAGFYGHVELEGQFRPFSISFLPRELREQLPVR